MRTSFRRILAGAAVIMTATTLAACGSSEESTATGQSATTTSATVSAPNVADDGRQKTFEHYISEERRTPLREALNRVGRDWMSRMLNGEIPSSTRGLIEDSEPPKNGYGFLSSDRAGSEYSKASIRVGVKFTNGMVDTRKGPLNLFVIWNGIQIRLEGETTFPERDVVVENGATAFEWELWPSQTSTCKSLYLVDTQARQKPGATHPLDMTRTYRVESTGYGSVFREVGVDIALINLADQELLAALNSLEVTSSDWPR